MPFEFLPSPPPSPQGEGEPFKKLILLFSIVFLNLLYPVLLFGAEPTGGIGVILEFLPDKKIHRVRAVFQGSPAAKARIQPGEEIISIDGTSTSGMSFEELGRRVRGNPGTVVTLVLRSPGSTLTREVPLTRVGQQTVSPLILNAPGLPGSPPRPVLTEMERSEVKDMIRRLKTDEEKKKMEKLLYDFRDGKITKAEFFTKLRADFPRSP